MEVLEGEFALKTDDLMCECCGYITHVKEGEMISDCRFCGNETFSTLVPEPTEAGAIRGEAIRYKKAA